ncbi:NucA/NucB deoxyribonuclease domain-containing protein [Lentzea xinjiangensis]|nr:hypothetical protein [Lentzea xinjiangensis]
MKTGYLSAAVICTGVMIVSQGQASGVGPLYDGMKLETVRAAPMGTADVADLARNLGRSVPVDALELGTKKKVDGTKRRDRTAAELAELARPGKYSFAPAEPSGAARLADEENRPVRDRVNAEECRNFFRATPPEDTPPYWFKNRFNACHGITLLSEHYEVRSGRPFLTGAMTVDAVVMVSMNENSRSAEVSVRLWDWNKIGEYPTNKTWTFGAGCWEPAAGGKDCLPDSVTHYGTPDQWASNPERTQSIQFPTDGQTIPEDPSPHGIEQRQIYEIDPYVYLPQSVDPAITFYDAPAVPQRCDQGRTAVSANYVRGSDCVFHEQAGVFQLSVSDDRVAESAQLIRDAIDNISSTKPGTAGKPNAWIPGKFGTAHPLHRLYHDQIGRDNNRAAAIEACKQHFGPTYTERNDPADPTATNDCDEYPFSTTYQGVQFTINDNTDRSFAVRPVLSRQNQKAGDLLGQFMANDHVGEEDPFYVLIRD